MSISLSNATASLTTVLDGKPPCAHSCWYLALASTNCDPGALELIGECNCSKIPLLGGLSTCIQKSCFPSDQIPHINTVAAICDGYDKPSRKAELIALAAAGMTLATVMVSLRCCARIVRVRSLGWDDWTALMALIVLLVMGSVGMIATGWGFGLHYWDANPQFSETIHQVFWALEIGYVLDVTIIKASIMLLFGRIFDTPGWHTAVKCFMLFTVAKNVAFLPPLIFQCKPLRAVWQPKLDGTCLNISAIGYAGAACSIIEDFILMVAPIPTLWRLQLPKTKRILLAVLFSIGSFATITSLIRLKSLRTFGRTDDLTWDNVDVVIWTGTELVCALACASIPPCWPLLSDCYANISCTATRMFQGKPMRMRELCDSEHACVEMANNDTHGKSPSQDIIPYITTNELSESERGYWSLEDILAKEHTSNNV